MRKPRQSDCRITDNKASGHHIHCHRFPPPTPAPAHSITLQEFSEAQLHYGGKEEQIEVHSCRRTRTHAPHRYKEVEEVRTRQREQPAYKGAHWQAFSLVVNTLHKKTTKKGSSSLTHWLPEDYIDNDSIREMKPRPFLIDSIYEVAIILMKV